MEYEFKKDRFPFFWGMDGENFSGGVYWLSVKFRECNDVFLVVFYHRMLSQNKNGWWIFGAKEGEKGGVSR